MRLITVVAMLPLLAACGSPEGVTHWSDSYADQDDLNVEPIDIEPELEKLSKSVDWGTERQLDGAKSVAWQDISTREKETYQGGTIVVDQILRHDGDGFFGVRVRLLNATAAAQNVEWKITFVTDTGARIASHYDEWRPINLQLANLETVADTSRIKGAMGFRLWVRKPGQETDDGKADTK